MNPQDIKKLKEAIHLLGLVGCLNYDDEATKQEAIDLLDEVLENATG